MERVHDLGGREGYGPVDVEDDHIGFAERWHAVVFAAMRAGYAAGAVRNSDQFRHSIERIDPDRYLTDTYYGRWLGGIESLCVEAGVLTKDELLQRCPIPLAGLREGPSVVADDWQTGTPGTAARDGDTSAKFAVGDAVQTAPPGIEPFSQTPPAASNAGDWRGHTRLPAYARGASGVVVARHGHWVYPDTNAHGLGEQPQWLYSVCFSGEALYGRDAEPGVEVVLDLFEPYLQHFVTEPDHE